MVEPDGRIIFVKHSLPEIIPDKPASQWQLGDEGRSRCRTIAGQIAPYQPDVIVSSIEPKAEQTAQLIAGVLGLSYETVKDLHEHERDNEIFDSNNLDFQKKVAHFFQYPDRLVYGRETGDQAYTRFSAALNRVIAANPRCTLVIVTHGTVISLLIARANKIEPFAFWQSLGLPSFVVTTSTLRLLQVITGVKSG